ncbi:hypothetical protein [Nitrogeniibacter aestuarii]|uniref:hypothetical protein n=1 Tax=Nitrogeniibacter aestuarii TaxID=2815343 RepID=UPI001D116905|nr:hypothetical protein [Nitrogeniibacter aestuarii]
MTPQSVEHLMEDIEREDPLDFGLLSIDEQDARQLMASHFCEVNEVLADQGLDIESRLEVMTAIAAHTMVENMLLNVERLKDQAADESFSDWLSQHGMK